MFKIVKIVSTFILISLFVSCNPSKSENQKTITLLGKKYQMHTYNNEDYIAIDFYEVNAVIAKKPDTLSAQAVMKEFHKIKYPYEFSTEGNRKTTITEQKLKNGNVEVKFIDENLMDDSINGEKFIMELTRRNNKWAVISLITNWKCQQGRGPNTWGIKLCR